MPSASPMPVSAIPSLPPRAPDSHKGDYGKILVIAGSETMIGAPAITSLAALRSGAVSSGRLQKIEHGRQHESLGIERFWLGTLEVAENLSSYLVTGEQLGIPR